MTSKKKSILALSLLAITLLLIVKNNPLGNSTSNEEVNFICQYLQLIKEGNRSSVEALSSKDNRMFINNMYECTVNIVRNMDINSLKIESRAENLYGVAIAFSVGGRTTPDYITILLKKYPDKGTIVKTIIFPEWESCSVSRPHVQ